MLKRRRLRRTTGAGLVVLGGVLMWFAPESIASPQSLAGVVLLLSGVAVEIAGIAIEHSERRSKP
jgi:hypothetical protein